MEDTERLSIGDLVRETGLSRRTIHYYLHEGLLPSPQGAGRRAYYLEEHLLRLRLISLLKEAGLKLDSIGTCLAGLGICEMRHLVERAEEACLDDPRELASWLHCGCEEATTEDPFLVSASGPTRAEGRESVTSRDVAPAAPSPGRAAPAASGPTWRRERVCPGVEIHVRSDLARERRSEIRHLLEVAEALLGD